MRGIMLAAVALLSWAGSARADEKDARAGSGGPPPGKGWRKSEAPAPAVPTAAPAPKQKGAKPVTAQPKQPAPPPTAKEEDDGIGPIVSGWARSGVHGRELAAKIHQLQATRVNAAPTPPPTAKPEKKGKPEVTPTPLPPKKKGKPGGEDD